MTSRLALPSQQNVPTGAKGLPFALTPKQSLHNQGLGTGCICAAVRHDGTHELMSLLVVYLDEGCKAAAAGLCRLSGSSKHMQANTWRVRTPSKPTSLARTACWIGKSASSMEQLLS